MALVLPINGGYFLRKRITVFILVSILGLAVLASCSSQSAEEAIVGTWVCNDNSQEHIWLCGLTFYANGRFTDLDGDSGRWSIFENHLLFDFDDFDAQSMNFDISGRRLTITDYELRIILDRQ